MTIFVDDTNWYYNNVGNLDCDSDPLGMHAEFCTVLNHKNFQIKLLHEAQGVGMSDRYYYRTVMEVLKDGEVYTSKLADLLWIKYPIEDNSSINKAIEWVYNNA